jgi:hypothetical protein
LLFHVQLVPLYAMYAAVGQRKLNPVDP